MSDPTTNTPEQTPWLEDVLGPVLKDADGNQFEPRTAGLHFVGCIYQYDPVLNIRRIYVPGAGEGSSLPALGVENAILTSHSGVLMYRLMTAGMHGEQLGGALHAAVTENANGFATPAMLAAISAVPSQIANAIPDVAGLDAIKALTTSSAKLVRDTSPQGDLWIRQPSGTATADDVMVVTVTNGSCQYHRIVGTGPTRKASAQATWYISDSGSAWDTGVDSSHPVPPDEIQRRWGGNNPSLPSSTTINYSTTIAKVCLSWVRTAHTVCVSLIGTTTVDQTCVLTALTPVNAPGNEVTLISATISGVTIYDWTPYIGKRLNFGAGGWARVVAAPSSGVARITLTMLQSGAVGDYITSPTPTVGQTFTIETVPEITELALDAKGPTGKDPSHVYSPYIYVRTVRTEQATSIRTPLDSYTGGSVSWDCDFTDLSALFGHYWYGGTYRQRILNGLPKSGFSRVAILKHASSTYTTVTWVDKEFSNNDNIAQGVTVAIYNSNCQPNNLAIFDSPDSGLMINDHCSAKLFGYLIGKGNAGAFLEMREGATLSYGGTAPSGTGAGGDWKIVGGVATGTFSWAMTPVRDFSHGCQQVTLGIGGAAPPFTIENLPSDAVVRAGRISPAGVIGDITRSLNTVGSITTVTVSSMVEDDRSVCWCEWSSSGSGHGGIFLR